MIDKLEDKCVGEDCYGVLRLCEDKQAVVRCDSCGSFSPRYEYEPNDCQYLAPEICLNIQKSKEDGGIFINKLEPGSQIIAHTKNSKYTLTTKALGSCNVTIQGGEYFEEPTDGVLSGSTWGGSMIKLGWIGKDMRMELWSEVTRTVTTTPVRKATVYGPEKKWHYDLWDDKD